MSHLQVLTLAIQSNPKIQIPFESVTMHRRRIHYPSPVGHSCIDNNPSSKSDCSFLHRHHFGIKQYHICIENSSITKSSTISTFPSPVDRLCIDVQQYQFPSLKSLVDCLSIAIKQYPKFPAQSNSAKQIVLFWAKLQREPASFRWRYQTATKQRASGVFSPDIHITIAAITRGRMSPPVLYPEVQLSYQAKLFSHSPIGQPNEGADQFRQLNRGSIARKWGIQFAVAMSKIALVCKGDVCSSPASSLVKRWNSNFSNRNLTHYQVAYCHSWATRQLANFFSHPISRQRRRKPRLSTSHNNAKP